MNDNKSMVDRMKALQMAYNIYMDRKTREAGVARCWKPVGYDYGSISLDFVRKAVQDYFDDKKQEEPKVEQETKYYDVGGLFIPKLKVE